MPKRQFQMANMKKNVLITSLLSLTLFGSIQAQQDKLITHFVYDKMSVNPGETGLDDGICATMMYRNQWDKVNGAPNSAVLNIEANMNRFFPGGLGISFYHDAIGFSRQNNVLLNYSYPLELGGAGTLGIGVGLGLVNFGMSPVWVPPTTNVDNTLPIGFTATSMDFNFGLYWKGNEDYYAGISSTHLNQSLLSSTINSTVNEYQMARHYYIMGGKRFSKVLADGDIDAQIMMRTDMVKFSADFNVRYFWKNIGYGGLTYRTVDAIGIMLGFVPMQNMTVGYSYDITTNKLANVSRGSHELVVKYCYFLPPPPVTKANHPRWL
jgi:type IX secretion system PorP/SprF family membrane protein